MFRNEQGIVTSVGDAYEQLDVLRRRVQALSQGNSMMRANSRGFVVFGRPECPHTRATMLHIQGLGFTVELINTPRFQLGGEMDGAWVKILGMVPNASKTVPHVFEVGPSGAYQYIGNGDIARMAIRKAEYDAGVEFPPGQDWDDVRGMP